MAMVMWFCGCGPVEQHPAVDLGVSTGALSTNGGRNVALSSRGASASASSQAPGAPAWALINGDRRGLGWGDGGGWSDYTFSAYPDSVVITFNGPKLIDEVDVFSLQDDWANPVEPVTGVTTFWNQGARSFSVARWSGSSWVTLATVTGNHFVGRKVTFAPVLTSKIRVSITLGATNGWSQLTEVEAWTASPGACASYCGGIQVRGCGDVCTTASGLVATCDQLGYACVGGALPPPCATACTATSACWDRCSQNGVVTTCETHRCDQPTLRGVVSTTYLPDVNRCVNDPVSQVLALPGTGVTESFAYPGSFPQTSSRVGLDCIDLDCGDHWQTIVRLPADPTRFAITLNQEDDTHNSGFIGLLGRDAGSAELMQQNDGSPSGHRYNHPGGAQALGTQHLFVGEEQQEGNIAARVVDYQQHALVNGLSGVNPLASLPQHAALWLASGIPEQRGAAAVAATKLAPLPGESGSRYLLLVASANYSFRVFAWVTAPGASLAAPAWGAIHTIDLGRVEDGKVVEYFNGWGPQQNMNLLTDCATGGLFLISWGDGGRVKLHRIELRWDVATGGLRGGLGASPAATRDVNCGVDDDYCQFVAGAGSYVTADGDLQVYGTSKLHSIRTAGYCNGGSCAQP